MLVSVKPSEKIWDILRAESDALEELQEIRQPYMLGVLREILHYAHAHRLNSEAARHRLERRVAEASGAASKLKLAFKSGVGRMICSERGLAILEYCEDKWSGYTKAAAAWDKTLERWKPDVVFNASHVHGLQARALLSRARRRGTPLLGFLFSWDNLTTQGRIIPRYDSYLVWSETMAQQLLQIYPNISPDQVIVTGSPQFDFHVRGDKRMSREEFCRTLGMDPKRPVILYTTGMPNHMPFEEEIVELLLHTLRTFPEPRRPQLMVRVYAKDATGRFERIFARHPDLVKAPVLWERNS